MAGIIKPNGKSKRFLAVVKKWTDKGYTTEQARVKASQNMSDTRK
jgi:hypothetical protein